ncbi:MAG: type IV secretion system DotC family protein, partial [Pseudomonadota bacterium]|nr:type IV secretion system DotC family protein [Pseudomonadota bacterium]
MKKTALAIGLSLLGLTACSMGSDQPVELVKIAALKQGGVSGMSNFRVEALRDTAIAIGAQGGLAWRAERIDCVLRCQAKMLDRIYNFRALLLRDNILPPVLGEGRDPLNIANCETIRAADIMYRIISPPCFVSNPPNWRDYLWMHYEKPEEPNATLLPKNRNEAAVWNCFVRQGWQQGIDQADLIFDANLARLNRDYHGM